MLCLINVVISCAQKKKILFCCSLISKNVILYIAFVLFFSKHCLITQKTIFTIFKLNLKTALQLFTLKPGNRLKSRKQITKRVNYKKHTHL